MRLVVVVPTYNEARNIGPLIGALQEQFRRLPAHASAILVVDDDSPDGTADAVRRAAERCDNVFLLTGKKRGLGAAYIRGIRHALSVLKAEAVMEMDADFSHKPEDVPRLVTALDEGWDFVIGSRYVPGGSIPEEWGLRRRWNSLFGNLVARHVAGISGVKDCTAGFRAIRASILERVDLEGLGVRGYVFQVALLHAALARGARVKEIPVDFVERGRGKSKLSTADILEFLAVAVRLRFGRPRSS